jgi:hypothetical protein
MYGASPLSALGPCVHSFPLMGLAWIVKQPLGLQKVTKVTSWGFLGYLTVWLERDVASFVLVCLRPARSVCAAQTGYFGYSPVIAVIL